MIRISRAAAVLTAALGAIASQQAPAIPGPRGTHTENGLAGFAKILCSGVFVSGRSPEDVAAAPVYFASDEAAWVSGAVLLLSGGAVMTSDPSLRKLSKCVNGWTKCAWSLRQIRSVS
mgnify:CR=1 FL=1